MERIGKTNTALRFLYQSKGIGLTKNLRSKAVPTGGHFQWEKNFGYFGSIRTGSNSCLWREYCPIGRANGQPTATLAAAKMTSVSLEHTWLMRTQRY